MATSNRGLHKNRLYTNCSSFLEDLSWAIWRTKINAEILTRKPREILSFGARAEYIERYFQSSICSEKEGLRSLEGPGLVDLYNAEHPFLVDCRSSHTHVVSLVS